MKKSVLIVVTLATVLAACSAGRIGDKGFNPFFVTAPVASRPNVFVKDDLYIVVDQEPIYIDKDASPVSITWAVADNSNYYFASNTAISVNPPRPNGFQCSLTGSPAQLITCTYDKVHKKKYIYTITLTNGTTQTTLTSDPSIMND